MPLIDLKTTLKDLKFNTRAPYIVKDINDPPTYNSLSDPITRRRDDVLRLTRMLADTPGAKFISNQAILQAYNKTNYESNAQTLLGQVAAVLSNAVVSTGRAAAITLAQAGLEGSGVRLTLPRPASFYYTDGSTGSSTALTSPEIVNGRGVQTIYSSRNSKYSELQINGEQNKAASKAFEGALNKHNYETEGSYVDLRANPDYLNDLPPTTAGRFAKNGSSITVKGEGKSFFGGTNKSDQVNLLDVGENLEDDNDLFAKIVFAKYNSKGSYSGTKVFRAFIGNISDTFTARWNANEYVGRMEQFFVYTGFTRNFSFPLQVPIFSEAEQPFVYNKVNSLISHTAPEYTGGTGIPSGIITHLEIGDYYKGPGVLNSVGVSIANDVQWSQGPSLLGGKGLILPQVLSLNLQFTPIHEVTPQATFKTVDELENDEYGKFRYVGNARLKLPEAVLEAQARAAEEARLARERAYEEYVRRNDLNSTPFFNPNI